jgi:hypothetical protein
VEERVRASAVGGTVVAMDRGIDRGIDRGTDRGTDRRTDRGRAALVALLLCGVVAVVAGTLWEARPPGGARADPSGSLATAGRSPERAVLARWDRARSGAWARGSPVALRRLYLPGAGAGRRDVRLLQRYADRGLRVEGLRTQVLSWEVLARRSDRLVLRVTDRLVGGVAVRPRGATRARLPADRPTERQLTLVRRGGRWVMARVA